MTDTTTTTTAAESIALAADLATCPFPAYAALREDGGVHQAVMPDGQPVWVVSRYADVKALLADSRLTVNTDASRRGYQGWGLPPALNSHLMNLDAADHSRLRRLVSSAFTPRRAEAMSGRIEQTANDLVSGFAPAGRADLVADFAAPLPISVICDLLGVPASEGTAFHAYTKSLMNHEVAGQETTMRLVSDMGRFLVELVARKRAQPGDDLLSGMIAAREGQDRMTDNELTSLAFLVLWAGYEASVHLIANSLATLLADPHTADIIRDQPTAHTGAMTAAVEELLRRDGPVLTAIRRFTIDEVPVGTTTIPAGDTVLLAIGSANRDPQLTSDPEILDLVRANNPHLGFGHGPHYCLGAPLARLETRIALWTLLRRLSDAALAVSTEQLPWKSDYRQRALNSLPITFAPQPAE
jgi:cytochrome P450